MKVYAGKVKAKSLIPIEEMDEIDMEHQDGWVTGWFADGMILGDVVDACDEYVTHEYYVPVDPETLEVAE